jgi:hypothetical protein
VPGFTNFPNGITSLGIPTFGTGFLPPFTGKYFFVQENYATGQAAGLGTAAAPFNTIQQALAQTVAGRNDVIFLIGTVHVSAAQGSILWANNNVHLIGLCDPVKRGKRARISVTGATGFNQLFLVTGSGCYFKNFQIFYGFPHTSGALIAWEDDGGRNCYELCEFLGFGDATASTGTANLTGARAFKFNNNTGESTFRSCVFGLDTLQRGATNYTLEIAGAAPRLTFEDCDFEADLAAGGASGSHVLIGSAGIDRYCKFKGCTFMDATLSGATAMAQAFNVSASAGGVVMLDGCTSFGVTAWETTPSNSVFNNMIIPTADGTGGKMLVL